MATWELQGCQSPKRSNLPYRLLSSVSSSCHQHLVPPSFISLFYLLTDISYIGFRCESFLYDSSNVFFVVYSPTRHHLPSCFYLSLCWSSSSLMFASFLSLSLPLLFISSILVMYICDVHYYIILSYEGLYHIGNKLKPCYSLVYSLYWNIYGLSV